MAPQILLVDDDRGFVRILADALGNAGYDVTTAPDGATAVDLVRKLQPELLLLDVQLPKKDGFETLQEIRGDSSLHSQPAVLFLSGCSPTPRYRQRARELAATDFLVKPLPLEEMERLVAKALGSGPPVRMMKVTAEHSGPLSGDLGQTPLPAVLHHLHGMRASGVLLLQNGDERRGIEFSEGQLAAVQSNLRSECLGNLLAATGKISWDVMHESLRRVQGGEGLQGQILVAMHMLDEQDLAVALRNQAEEKLFQAFGWDRGRFHFTHGAALRNKNRLRLKRSVGDSIMQGVRTRTPLGLIEAFFAENRDGYLAPSQSSYYRFQDIDLAVDEQRLLSELEAGLSLWNDLPKDEGLLRSLYGFAATELVELRRGQPPRPPAPALEAAHVPGPAFEDVSHPESETALQKDLRQEDLHQNDPRSEGPGPEPGPAIAAGPGGSRPSPLSAEEADLRAELLRMAEDFRGADPFEILNVPHRTTDEEVRLAYHALAKHTHPDRLGAVTPAVRELAEQVFARVSEAYDALIDHDGRVELLRRMREEPKEKQELAEGHRALEAELSFQKGETALAKKRYAEAEGHFRLATETYPEEGEYSALAAWSAYLTQPERPGQLQASLEEALEARKLAPKRERIYLILGKLYKLAGRLTIAERMFGRAVELDPDCLEAVRELRVVDMRRQRESGGVLGFIRRCLGSRR